jgi:hypothetical protein
MTVLSSMGGLNVAQAVRDGSRIAAGGNCHDVDHELIGGTGRDFCDQPRVGGGHPPLCGFGNLLSRPRGMAGARPEPGQLIGASGGGDARPRDRQVELESVLTRHSIEAFPQHDYEHRADDDVTVAPVRDEVASATLSLSSRPRQWSLSQVLGWLVLVIVVSTSAYGFQLTANSMVPAAEAHQLDESYHAVDRDARPTPVSSDAARQQQINEQYYPSPTSATSVLDRCLSTWSRVSAERPDIYAAGLEQFVQGGCS